MVLTSGDVVCEPIPAASSPRGNGTHYMMYAQANCVGFRDEAVGRLSEFGAVHCGGKCGGRSPIGDNSNLTKVRTNVKLRNWWTTQKYTLTIASASFDGACS